MGKDRNFENEFLKKQKRADATSFVNNGITISRRRSRSTHLGGPLGDSVKINGEALPRVEKFRRVQPRRRQVSL
jgi:hypothetical protein